MPQQIGVNPMVWMLATRIRPRTHRCNAHLLHIATDRIACERPKRRFQENLELARPIERAGRKQFIDAMLDRDFSCRWWNGLVIEMRAADTEQVGLRPQGQRVRRPLDQRSSEPIREGGSFFSAS